MSDDLFQRMERIVRRFGGELAIDVLLPELEAEKGVFLQGGPVEGETAGPPPEDSVILDHEIDEFMSRDDGEEAGVPDFLSRSIDPNTD